MCVSSIRCRLSAVVRLAQPIGRVCRANAPTISAKTGFRDASASAVDAVLDQKRDRPVLRLTHRRAARSRAR
jgi:hypothetical protein